MMKHPIIDTHKPTRADSEEVLRMLCDSYPKCFFETPRQRRPLKHNITSDIIEDGFGVAPELITAAVDWYQSHIGYAFATTAGDKRIDLEGRPVGTVTEREATSAKQKIDEYNKKQNDLAAKKRQNERAAVESPAKVLGEMYTSGQISDDAVKKLDAPPRSKAVAQAPEFTPLYETLATANAAVFGVSDPIMRAAVAKASLDVVIKKCQQVMLELEKQGGRS